MSDMRIIRRFTKQDWKYRGKIGEIHGAISSLFLRLISSKLIVKCGNLVANMRF